MADRLADAYRRTGDIAQGIRVLRNYEDQYPSLDLLTTLFNQILAHDGPDAGTQLIKDELSRNPTLLGLDKLLEAQLMEAPAGAVTIWSWSRRWSASTSSGWACIGASNAAFAPSSIIGVARAAANGKRTRRDGPRRRMDSREWAPR